MRIIWHIIAISTVFFSSSSFAQSEVNISQPSPPADANVYIYREHAEPTVWSPTVKIDGVKLVALGNKSFTAAHVALGVHQVTLTWPLLSGQKAAEMDLNVEADKTYYLEVTGIS